MKTYCAHFLLLPYCTLNCKNYRINYVHFKPSNVFQKRKTAVIEKSITEILLNSLAIYVLGKKSYEIMKEPSEDIL